MSRRPRFGRSFKPLRRPLLWGGLWIAAIAAVVVLSLAPSVPMPDVPDGDKLGHFLAYFALAEAGTHAGFEFAGYCNQTSLLLGNRLEQRLAAHEASATDEAGRYTLRQQAKRLTLPGEMGERFQAIAFARGVDEVPAGLRAFDLSRRL